MAKHFNKNVGAGPMPLTERSRRRRTDPCSKDSRDAGRLEYKSSYHMAVGRYES